MTAEIKYGPSIRYGKRTCEGCAAFTTEAWSAGDDGEGHAEDFGLEARCNYGGNSSQITAYYSAFNDNVPAWCPAEEVRRAEIPPSTECELIGYSAVLVDPTSNCVHSGGVSKPGRKSDAEQCARAWNEIYTNKQLFRIEVCKIYREVVS